MENSELTPDLPFHQCICSVLPPGMPRRIPCKGTGRGPLIGGSGAPRRGISLGSRDRRKTASAAVETARPWDPGAYEKLGPEQPAQRPAGLSKSSEQGTGVQEAAQAPGEVEWH